MNDSWTIAREALHRAAASWEMRREPITFGGKIRRELRILGRSPLIQIALHIWKYAKERSAQFVGILMRFGQRKQKRLVGE